MELIRREPKREQGLTLLMELQILNNIRNINRKSKKLKYFKTKCQVKTTINTKITNNQAITTILIDRNDFYILFFFVFTRKLKLKNSNYFLYNIFI